MTARSVLGGPQARTQIPFTSTLFQTQVQITGVVALVVSLALILPGGKLLDGPALFLGLTTILWVVVLVSAVPWSRFHHQWQIVIPLLDMVAIMLFRLSAPQSGFGVLLAFPVIWMATSFGRLGRILGPAFSAMLLWTQVIAERSGWLSISSGSQGPTAATSLSLTMAFIAGVIHASARRDAAQRILLRRQTDMVEDALDRARRGETTLREVLDAVDFAVIGLDAKGRVLAINRATRKLFTRLGLPQDTPLWRFPLYAADKVTPVVPEDFPHERAMRGEPIDGETYWIGHPTDVHLAISVSVCLLHDEAGAVDRIVVAAHDITAETRAVQDRDDLVTSMSHELRTPLSSILGYVDLTLEDPTLSTKSRKMLEIAVTNTERIMALLGDLLAARSSGRSSAMVIRPTGCDLAQIVRESMDAVRVLASDRMVTMSLESPEQLAAVVDPFRVRQVVDNLLSNAIKYNELGGRVQIRLAVSGTPWDGVRLTVADRGRGMTPEEQKGLFERFYRAESVRGTTIHGTGLGLSICRQIVELHHGEIGIESESGKGTAVTVRLPLVTPRVAETAGSST